MKSYQEIKEKIQEEKELHYKRVPHAIVFYTDKNESLQTTYDFLEYLGFEITLKQFKSTVTNDELAIAVWRAGQVKDYNVIFVQLPLPTHIDTAYILKYIPIEKHLNTFLDSF